MRAFISINLSPTIQAQIRDVQAALRDSVRGIRWTAPENCHLTLKFLGEFPESCLPTLGQVLDPVAAQFSPFSLEFGTFGTFPPRGPVSIVWLGLTKGESTVRALEEEMGKALHQAGIAFDKKQFVPHLTIGRAQRNQTAYFNGKSVPAHSGFDPLRVEAFYAMQSELTPQGPIYTPRLRFPFPQGAK
ncbi:MAG: RNA 2',3'-cyclic phosphodiesterase [bacterium]|jgi:2'-5' RNA ligase|nr:RNA 2',3'-cyclic phosphodiesterase [bacterium]